jgi:putative oxidoreductase
MLKRFEPYAYALLRIVAGFMFAMHGSQKLLGWPPSEHGGGALPPLMLVAGVIELVGGLMILFGFFASIAAFIASGEMAAAFFMAHFPKGWNPLLNEGEVAALYSFLFLYVATRGSGIWSIDALLGKRTTGATQRTSAP